MVRYRQLRSADEAKRHKANKQWLAKNLSKKGAAKKYYAKKYNAKKYTPTPLFKRQMRKYENTYFEKNIIPYKNYTIGQATYQLNQLVPVPLINFGPTGNIAGLVSCVVLQSGETLTDNNTNLNQNVGTLCTAIGGYGIAGQGSSSAEITGRYARITSSKLNFNIQMVPSYNVNGGTAYAPTIGDMLPHQFRFIQVKRKMRNSVAPGAESLPVALTPDLATSLFIDERGIEVGLTSAGATQDCWTHFINKQKWQVLCDQRFTLANAAAHSNDINQTALTPSFVSAISRHPSQKFMSKYMPKVDKKIRWGFNPTAPIVGPTQPVDYNYVVHTIVLCKSQNLYDTARNWQIEVNGTTSLIDV